ncbi:MAG TPA: ABC transporter permease [Clostridium sp.]|uniref:ABC transporter permease n=1 Tax=Clostridium sp. TaxID=1506 RepID=UPI002F932AB7
MQIGLKMKNKLSDTIVMSNRCMCHAFRSMDTLITLIAMPIVMMLMLVYVFGGAINTGSVDYINFVVPGIVIMCISTGTAYSALRLNNDITKGIIDRFRSMPIAESSILGGHVLTSVVFNAFSIVLVVLSAVLMGFRTHAGITEWFLVTLILLLFTLAMTWISMMFGLLAKSAEGASAFSYLFMILIFISSAFVPINSMHGIVRSFAQNQPMTPIIETIRSLLMGVPTGNGVLISVLWCSGILIASYFGSLQIYKHKMA